MSNQDDFNQCMGSMLDVLTVMTETSSYPDEALAMIRKRAEAIREAVKNNPLPELPPPCKQPVH